jgi:FAD/FMN-containing dehydrogenase
VTFEEIIRLFIPKGWFMPVTPGTKFITVGGAIGSDIHGKNHHAKGTFSDHVYWFELITPNGNIVKCSKTENAELFALTCGGMGLTGLITKVCFQLQAVETSYIRQEAIKAKNLDDIMRIFEDSSSWTNSVAWIDCLAKGKSLGKCIMTRGEFAKKSELNTAAQRKEPLKVHKEGKLFLPFDFPSFTINSLSVKAFNFLYYNKQFKEVQHSIVHYETFYYPLDGILHWNRIYGKNGFTQYQFVLPPETSREGLIAIIEKIGERKMGSFLTVLKLFGVQDENYIRFPKGGYTLAIDFKINPKVWKFLDELDELVLKYGGRVYLTKDVRMNYDMLVKSYPQAATFIEKIKQLDPDFKFASVQSERMHMTDAKV